MNGIVQILTKEMLELRQMILAAIFMHYGWEQKEGGQFVQGKNGRSFRVPTDVLNIKRADFFQREYLGANTVVELFTKGEVADSFKSNFRYSVLPQDKFYVITGVRLRVASGAGAAAIDTLAFDTVTINNILNGLISLEVNGKKEVENEPIASKFIHNDVMPNMFRLAEPIVWEPNSDMSLQIRLPRAFNPAAAAPETYWIEAELVGYLLEK